MDDIKLKPCPFCGNKAEITKRNHSEEGLVLKVGCANSFCFCRITRNLWINWTKTEVEYEISRMVETWNNREKKIMDEIELVIKIPQEEYEMIVNSEDCGLHTITRAIARGTTLRKGHGRIGDLDALRCENADFDTYNDYCTMFDEIEAAETIVEADKENKDGSNN